MPLKFKLILLTLLPLLLVTASISWISIHQAKSLGEREVEIFRANLIKARETALKTALIWHWTPSRWYTTILVFRTMMPRLKSKRF